MTGRVSLYKIRPPDLIRILPRPRLTAFLEKNKNKQVCLLLGPAASGKSTLAADFVRYANIPCAWVNLGREDADPVNLYYSLIASLQQVTDQPDFETLFNYPSIDLGYREPVLLFREWADALFGQLSRPVRVVFDGLDQLGKNAFSAVFLRVLLEQAPETVSFMLLSRHWPDLGIEDFRIKGKAVLLKNEALAFTVEETKAFFKDTRGLSIPMEQVQKIHRFTEGWIGGLILLSETLLHLPPDSRRTYLQDGIPDRFMGETFRYFGEEILSAQPRDVQAFLIRSSIFDVVEPGFLQDLLGGLHAVEVLETHVKKNLFVQSVFDPNKGRIYRYHPMFRGFLLAKFASEIPEKERHALHFRAGEALEKTGALEDAVEHYLKAGAYDRAIAGMERTGLALLKEGRVGDLKRWLEHLPESLIPQNPWLLFFLSMTRRFTAVDDNMESLGKAHLLFKDKKDVRGQILALAAWIEATILRGHDKVPIAQLLEEADRIQRSEDAGRWPNECGILWCQMGFALTVRGGDPRKGYWACQNAVLAANASGDLLLQINALVNAMQALCWLGEFPLADKKFPELKNLVRMHPSPGVRLLYEIMRSESFLFRGDLVRAQESIAYAQNEAERHGLTYLYPVTLLYDLFLKPWLGKYAEAEDSANRLLGLASSMGNTFYEGLTRLYLARSFYFEGRFPEAADCLEDASKILSSRDVRSEYHLCFIGILKGFFPAQKVQEKQREKGIEKALVHLHKVNSTFAADAHLAMALVKNRLGKIEKSLLHLNAGFKIAKEKGIHRLPFVSPRDYMSLCILALELEAEEVMDYASHLLKTKFGDEVKKALEGLNRHRNERLREKVKEVLRSIHRFTAPVIQIHALGGFKVLVDGEAIPETRWRGSQSKNLLKGILAHGPGEIPQEVLMEAIWPETDPETGERNLKVALHRLRKALEPALDPKLGSSYVHLKQGCLSLDPELCETDVNRFLSLAEEGRTIEKAGDFAGAVLLYSKAVEAYAGDFLPQDLYDPLAGARRQEIKRFYLDLLFSLARLHESRNALKKAASCYKRAVCADPLLEEAYQHLMLLFFAQGKRNEAVRTFEECSLALKKELGVDPEPTTLAIYRKITE